MRRRRLIGLAALGALLVGVPLLWRQRWHYIAIHHSGGSFGDLEFLKRVHRERQPRDPVDEIPYHFVIGNGNGMPMGAVMPTGRWERGLWGAHLSGRNVDRNARGIGICLIGNFEENALPEAQFVAVVGLTRDLIARLGISAGNVTLHGKTPGEQTLCPGRNFPQDRFFAALTEAT